MVMGSKIIGCTTAFWSYVDVMDWQQLVSLMIVAVTAGWLAASKFRRRRFSFQRDTHCGCTAAAASAPRSSLIFRARKGERPEVLVKMR
jgi:hypothetical protein